MKLSLCDVTSKPTVRLRVVSRKRLIRFRTVFDGVKDEHHSHVFVFQVMAVEHEWTGEGTELHEDLRLGIRA